MSRALQNICAGEEPWIALGNFLNSWYVDAKDHRYDLVSEPLPETPTDEYFQHWAAYCAASVEHLCVKYHEPCPQWVHDPKYVLATPWYENHPEHMHDWIRSTTPEEFKNRNVYSGNRMFRNKWELAERYKNHPKPDWSKPVRQRKAKTTR
jgi:hypothetical protein